MDLQAARDAQILAEARAEISAQVRARKEPPADEPQSPSSRRDQRLLAEAKAELSANARNAPPRPISPGRLVDDAEEEVAVHLLLDAKRELEAATVQRRAEAAKGKAAEQMVAENVAVRLQLELKDKELLQMKQQWQSQMDELERSAAAKQTRVGQLVGDIAIRDAKVCELENQLDHMQQTLSENITEFAPVREALTIASRDAVAKDNQIRDLEEKLRLEALNKWQQRQDAKLEKAASRAKAKEYEGDLQNWEARQIAKIEALYSHETLD